MAKKAVAQGSPVRLSEKLIKKAKAQGNQSYRSLPQQIEFWASIGQKIEPVMTPADLAALAAGEIEIIRKKSSPLDMDLIFDGLEQDRKRGALSSKVIKDDIWYEESTDYPGYLVRMNTLSGKKELGEFVDGTFQIKTANSLKEKSTKYRR